MPVTAHRAALVVNTHSRTGERAYEQAERTLRELGVPVSTCYPLHEPSRLPETVSGAVDDGHDLIILGGGDGTVSSVVDVLAHRQVPMALLPLGTANDFARTLHVPTDLDQACRTLVEGKVVDIDLGLCGDNYYVNRASMGLGPLVAECMSPTLKKRTGPLAYPVATLKALRRHRPFGARLTFPDGEHPPQEFDSLLQVSVANGRYFGGGQLTVADSGIDDSTLDVSVIRHGSIRELIAVAPPPQERSARRERPGRALPRDPGARGDRSQPSDQCGRRGRGPHPARLLGRAQRAARGRAEHVGRRPAAARVGNSRAGRGVRSPSSTPHRRKLPDRTTTAKGSSTVEYRQLGRSGLRVSVLTLGTMTFGGKGGFGVLGDTDVAGARRQVDMCLEAGVNLFDTANMYSTGVSEEILGEAVKDRRDDLLLSTKVRMAMGEGPNDAGLSRHHVLRQAEASLRRLGTDHIDVYHVHEWDGQTPLEETLDALDALVRSGKVRYLAVSNYAGWQLMKALAVADRYGYQRFVGNQVYYSLESRDAEYELLPLSVDQGLGVLVWSPLADGLLSGK